MNSPKLTGLALAESEVDPATGLSIKGRARMASLLKISERQLDRLTADGVLPQRPDGLYEVRLTIDRHAVYLASKSSKPSRLDAQKARQSELIRRRLAREAEGLIPLSDALADVGKMRAAYLDAIREVGERSGAGTGRLEGERRRDVARLAAAQLDARMAPEIEQLRTGRKGEEQ